MVDKVILVAGATGNLGERIVKALLKKEVEVRILARSTSNVEKINSLQKLGAKLFIVNMTNQKEIAEVCKGVHCVVSALSGLEDVVVDTQKILLNASIAAGVQRFIPTDFSLDFTNLPAGQNRNLDFRLIFLAYIDSKNISATTIFNGPFTDLLKDEMPMILFKQRKILHWGDADYIMDFTTMNDTAEFTAEVAIDSSSPRFLRIAGDQISARELAKTMSDITGNKFRLFRPGGPGLLGIITNLAKIIAPGKKELYPAWQGMQYMRNMLDERGKIDEYDNDRYLNIKWTSVREMLSDYLNKNSSNT
jgi:nucleoside-diphosphate-sugar epimerase